MNFLQLKCQKKAGIKSRKKQLINFQKDKKNGEIQEWHFGRNGQSKREKLTYKAHTYAIMSYLYCSVLLSGDK